MTSTERERLAAALERLYARVPIGMRLGLRPMTEACARAGNPERSFRVVHVAGTNGKGSTCAMVERMLHASGQRTGLYTSPHLCRFAERVRVDGEPLDDAALTRALEEALTVGADLSFFETATLAAFLAFRHERVETAVVEVGIGGRLDATNVVTPAVTAITRVAFDHMDRLGHTLEAIAFEKAGIAKAGVPLVLGPLDGDAARVVREQAALVGAPVIEDGDDHVTTDLEGAYQIDNARLARAIGRTLGLDARAITTGLRDARWPGRFERITSSDGPYLLDGAHNPDGAAALVRSLGPTASRRTLVFGAMADKSWTEVLDILAPRFEHRVYVSPRGRAAAAPELLAARHPGAAAGSVEEALGLARLAAGAAGQVVVSGSLYLVGEARARLLDLPQDPPVAL